MCEAVPTLVSRYTDTLLVDPSSANSNGIQEGIGVSAARNGPLNGIALGILALDNLSFEVGTHSTGILSSSLRNVVGEPVLSQLLGDSPDDGVEVHL